MVCDCQLRLASKWANLIKRVFPFSSFLFSPPSKPHFGHYLPVRKKYLAVKVHLVFIIPLSKILLTCDDPALYAQLISLDDMQECEYRGKITR